MAFANPCLKSLTSWGCKAWIVLEKLKKKTGGPWLPPYERAVEILEDEIERETPDLENVLNIVSLLSEIGESENALELSLAVSSSLQSLPENTVFLARNLQLQGGILENMGRVQEAAQAIELSSHLNMLAGRVSG
jgi:tetratricopeptide (TPR) repeat protein